MYLPIVDKSDAAMIYQQLIKHSIQGVCSPIGKASASAEIFGRVAISDPACWLGTEVNRYGG